MPLGNRCLRGGEPASPLVRLLPLLAALVIVAPAGAEDRFGPPRDGDREDLPANRDLAPATARPVTGTPPRPLSSRFVRVPAPIGASGQPTVMIDAGAPDAGPTEAERLKLGAARAAIERARLAGTLYRVRAPRGEELPLPADWEALKRARVRAMAPKPFADDPAAGVGPMPSVQKSGPAGLTPAEEAKRRAPQPSPQDREPNGEGR